MERVMIKGLLTTTAALTLAGAAFVASAPAQAQVGVEIGPGGARVYDRSQVERRVIERRTGPRRVVVEEDDDNQVCETRTRRVRVNGVWRTRRVTVCD
jgi:hypothetical protein